MGWKRATPGAICAVGVVPVVVVQGRRHAFAPRHPALGGTNVVHGHPHQHTGQALAGMLRGRQAYQAFGLQPVGQPPAVQAATAGKGDGQGDGVWHQADRHAAVHRGLARATVTDGAERPFTADQPQTARAVRKHRDAVVAKDGPGVSRLMRRRAGRGIEAKFWQTGGIEVPGTPATSVPQQ